MTKALRYFITSFGFVTLGLLLGFKIDSYFKSESRYDIDKNVKKLEQALAFIERNYVKSPNHEALMDDAMRGMLDGLDPHSFYISKEEMYAYEEQIEGSFEGIGIEYSIIEDTLYVISPIKDGPSDKAGILAGDKIIKVDGAPLSGLNLSNTTVIQKLKGEKGSKVKLQVKRSGADNLMDFTVTRGKITLNSVTYAYMISPEVGYIQLSQFSENTYTEFLNALLKLKEEGMKNLVLDLRGNPGGYMMMANRIADEFLPRGMKIVSTIGRTAESKQDYFATNTLNSFETGAVVVLIDYGSASASEILAGAIQDHDRGLIVGVRSFGKGLVQNQKKFDDGSAMRIVVSEYHTPSGRCIQKPYDHKTHEQYENEIEDRFTSGEIFDPTKVKFADSLKFKTDAGRIVYGGGGIFPDVFVPEDTTYTSPYLSKILAGDLLRRFSFHYIDTHPFFKQNFTLAKRFVQEYTVDDVMLKLFVQYCEAHKVPFVQTDYNKSLPYIKGQIKAFIGKRMFQDDGFFPSLHQSDIVVQTALKKMAEAAKMAKAEKHVEK